MNATIYTVIGQLGDEPNHEFGDYETLSAARHVWASHDDQDGPVRIEKRTRAGDVLRTWRAGWIN